VSVCCNTTKNENKYKTKCERQNIKRAFCGTHLWMPVTNTQAHNQSSGLLSAKLSRRSSYPHIQTHRGWPHSCRFVSLSSLPLSLSLSLSFCRCFVL